MHTPDDAHQAMPPDWNFGIGHNPQFPEVFGPTMVFNDELRGKMLVPGVTV